MREKTNNIKQTNQA